MVLVPPRRQEDLNLFCFPDTFNLFSSLRKITSPSRYTFFSPLCYQKEGYLNRQVRPMFLGGDVIAFFSAESQKGVRANPLVVEDVSHQNRRPFFFFFQSPIFFFSREKKKGRGPSPPLPFRTPFFFFESWEISFLR